MSVDDTINDTLKLTKKEQQIFSLIVNNNKITRKGIVNQTNLSDRTISRIIKNLQDKKLILREDSKNRKLEVLE